jgi:hypothetical protein
MSKYCILERIQILASKIINCILEATRILVGGCWKLILEVGQVQI